LDTNISVRAGNKNWSTNIEDSPAFTAAIFMVYKFYPFILNFLFLFAFHFTKDNSVNKDEASEEMDLTSDKEQSKFIKDSQNKAEGKLEIRKIN
jgi:hypothetical protein